MKLLCYQARSFSWKAHSQTIPEAEPSSEGEVHEAAVIWLHIEESDEQDRNRIFKHTIKQIKWIANKRNLRNIVLHSFAHLGGKTASPLFAKQLLNDLSSRLRETQYQVYSTPFGWFCSWNLDVYGDSMAKVFQHIEAKNNHEH